MSEEQPQFSDEPTPERWQEILDAWAALDAEMLPQIEAAKTAYEAAHAAFVAAADEREVALTTLKELNDRYSYRQAMIK